MTPVKESVSPWRHHSPPGEKHCPSFSSLPSPMGRSKYSGPNCLWKHHHHAQREGEVWFTNTLSTLKPVKLTIKINSYTAPLNTSSEPHSHNPSWFFFFFFFLIWFPCPLLLSLVVTTAGFSGPLQQHPNRPSCFQGTSHREVRKLQPFNITLFLVFAVFISPLTSAFCLPEV